MDKLTRYVFSNYYDLMTFYEKAAYKSVLGQDKQEKRTSIDPQVADLLRDGSQQFMICVRERILREHPDQVFLNYCSRCGALARTPQARQYPKCFHPWHDTGTVPANSQTS